MRLGQISVVHFVSKLLASILGFAATLGIARLLGANVLGIYTVALTVVSWLALFGTMGLPGGITKRVSEQREPAQYTIAGAVLELGLFVLLGTGILLGREYVNEYVGFPAAGFVVAMLGVLLAFNLITSVLNGQHLVHVAGVLSPIKTGSRATLQIGALLVGLEIAALFGGYVLGHLVVIALGGFVVVRSFDELALPERHHFRRILSYAKYSWVGGLRGKAFNWVDIAVLRFFVSNSFIGYYAAAWNIAQFLLIFGTSVSQTLFPEMSQVSAEEDSEAVENLLHAGLSYAGLLLIPGLIGGTVLGERILRIYGPEFRQAELVMSILIVATLFQAYQSQLTTTLNAIDRPDLSFRVNIVFVGANVGLNVTLIYLYGWVGAAVATATSVLVSIAIAYYYLSSLVPISIPIAEISKQWLAAGAMGAVVLGGLHIETVYVQLGHNVAVVLTLVWAGAAVYFGVLFGISGQFRRTVSDNLPV